MATWSSITLSNFTKKSTTEIAETGIDFYDYRMSCDGATFQGFPIASVLIRDYSAFSNKIYIFRLIFEDAFYEVDSIPAIIQDIEFDLVRESGVSYKGIITELQFNRLKNFDSAVLKLSEDTGLQHPHLYNLWNQGWGYKRMTADTDNNTLAYPIDEFYSYTGGKYPSNSDSVGQALYADSYADASRTARRFFPVDLEANPSGNYSAPKGRYIIDAMDRGASRYEKIYDDMSGNYYESTEVYRLQALEMSTESSSGGATTVEEYAGRVWYGGFSGDSADSTIPLSNKILYSQIGDNKLYQCYQEADPTSPDDSSLVDTDGGWITIDGAEDVIKLVSLDTGMLVFASNGVWSIAGLDGNMFTPTSSSVTKITEKGSVNLQGIVIVDSSVLYWSEDGIYRIASNGYADFKVESMTQNTIHSLISELSEDDMEGISGAYDQRQSRIYWLIDTSEDADSRRALIYHITFNAFTIDKFVTYYGDDAKVEVVHVLDTPLYETTEVEMNIIVGGSSVISNEGSNIVTPTTITAPKDTNIAYIIMSTNDDSTIDIGFGDTSNEDFEDFGGVDAAAYLVTGYASGGDTARYKGAQSITMHFYDTGVEEEDETEDEDLV